MPSNCDFSSQLNEIQDLIAAIGNTDTSALESRLNTLENDVSSLQAQLGNLNGRLPIIEANALAGMTNGQKAMAAIAALAAGMAALEAKAAIAESLAKQAQQQALQAIGVGGQAIAMGNANRGLLEGLRGQIGSLSGQVASNAGKLAGLVGKVAGIAAAIAGIGGLALGLRNSQAIDALKDSVSGLAGRMKNAEDRLKDQSGLINALANQYKNLGARLKSEVSRLEELIGQRFSDLVQLINSLRGNGTDRIEREIDRLWASLGSLAGRVGANGLDGRVDKLERGLQNVGSRVGAIGNEVGGLNQRVNGVENSTGLLRNLTNSLNNTAARHGTQIAGILGTLAALGAAVAALQARKLMCRYNEAQVGAIAKSTAAIAATTTALQGMLNSIVIPFTYATTATLTTITTAVNAVKTGVTAGFKWLAIDRVLNVFNLIGTLHNASFLSRDIVESMLDISDTVLAIMGKELKDSEGNAISTGELIGGRIERAIISKIGVDAYAELRVRWHRFSTIYTSAANVFNSLRSISDSIVSGVEIAASYSAKIGNSLQRFGVIPERVFPWMTENPNFNSRLMNSLEKGEEVASSLSSVTSEVLSISEESKEIANNSLELKARLASKNPEDGTDWNIESGIQAESEEIRERATQFENVTFDDIPYQE